MMEISAETNAAEWEELQRVTRFAKTGRRDGHGTASGVASGGTGSSNGIERPPPAADATDAAAASPAGSSAAAGSNGGTAARRMRKRDQPRQQRQLDKYGFIVSESEREEEDNSDDGESLATDAAAHGRGRRRRRPQNHATNGTSKAVATTTEGGREKDKEERRVAVRREKKWTKMMSDWDRTKVRRKKKLRRRIRKGVPHSVRGTAWARLGNVPRKIEVEEVGTYDGLVRRSADEAAGGGEGDDDGDGDSGLDEDGPFVATARRQQAELDHESDRNRATPSATRETIERDINRTFPRHHLFAESSSSSLDSSSEEEGSDSGLDCAGDGGRGECDGDSDNNGGSAYGSDRDPSEKAEEDRVPAWGSGSEEGGAAASTSTADADSKRGAIDSAGLPGGKSPTTTSAIVAAHKGGGAVNISKKLLDAMQKCNANLDQVEMIMSSATIPTRAEISSMAAASGAAGGGEHEADRAQASAGGGGTGASTGGGASSSSPKKLTKAEKREQRIANYRGATGGQASLRRVLRAYSVYDRDVGYCQGMNFIAAMFITFMSEEEAFWLLVAVMNEPPCKMRGLFGEGMSGAHMVLHVAEKLIGQFLPKLSRHMEQENIHITMFATQWLLTLYTSSFPFELVTRVWDCFLAEGWKIVYRVMLALLDQASPDLMKLRFEEILGYFRELPSKVDGDVVFERAFAIPLRRRHIEKYEREWKARQNSS